MLQFYDVLPYRLTIYSYGQTIPNSLHDMYGCMLVLKDILKRDRVRNVIKSHHNLLS